MRSPPIVLLAAQSVAGYVRLGFAGRLRLRHRYDRASYIVKNDEYQVFRETENSSAQGEIVILVVGFRLRLIRGQPILHWLFQRVCIFTTPFWSGLPGFGIKLWMVAPVTKNYVGIYDWRGKADAQRYIDYLLPILRVFSVKGSVWSEQLYGQKLEEYLLAQRFEVASQERAVLSRPR